jgi:hypothetical protein
LGTKQGLFQGLTQPGNTTLPKLPGITPDTPAFVDEKPADTQAMNPALIPNSPFQLVQQTLPRLTRNDQYKVMDTLYPSGSVSG